VTQIYLRAKSQTPAITHAAASAVPAASFSRANRTKRIASCLRTTHEVALVFWSREHLAIRALLLPSQVIASRVSYVLLRCERIFAGLSLRSSQFAASTPFGVRPSIHPRSPPPGEYACVPSFPSRQESAVNYLFANVRGSTRAAIAIVDRQSALMSDQDSRNTLTPSKGAITWTLLLS
jgi:hypothetical protein